MSEYEKDIIRTSSQHVSDVISINKELTEKTLRMRCQAYLAHVKSQLLTQTVYEISSSKKVLKELNKELVDTNLKLKRQQKIIAEQKEEWERTFNALSIQVCILDVSGTILRANKAMRKCFETTYDTIIGMDYSSVYYGTLTTDFQHPYTAVLSGASDKVSVEARFPTIDGWYQVSLYPLHDSSGKQCGAVSVVEDITERKNTEEELVKMQKLESVGILAGGIAHDFNNNLQSLVGCISLAKLHENSINETHEHLEEAMKVVLQSRDLTKQLLTFSKGGDPIKKVISTSELINESSKCATRGTNVRCELDLQDCLCSIEVDKGQMNQVFNNLFMNADHAMPEGGVVNVKAECVNVDAKDILPLQEGKYVKIVIKDQGTGISEENLQKIFDPYFTTKEKGSGLGLAISYSIIKKHDGHITVESEMGVGTTFYVYLPVSVKKKSIERILSKAEGSRPVTAKGKGAEKTALSCKKKVLFMDDENLIRLAIPRHLRSLKYEVETARDGFEAIELYKSASESGKFFDAVILDLTIPGGMGGKDTIERLLEIDPEIKAIVASGYADDPVMTNYKEYGFKGMLEKPYEIDELDETLQKVITEKEEW